MTITGNNINIFLYLNNEWKTIAHARQASISMDTEMKEVSSPTTGTSKAYIPGRQSWTMAVNCLLSTDETIITTAYNNRQPIHVSFQDTASTTKYHWHGQAYIKSLKAQADINQMATFTVDLQGTGTLTYEQLT